MFHDNRPQFDSSREQWERLKPFAKDMRHAPTPAEEKLWQHIRNRRIGGAKFRRQHSIHGFIVDFVCLEQQLIVEVDGEIHDLPDQHEYDVQRQAFLEAIGFRVLRFRNEDVLTAADAVTEVIGQALQG
jgi:very-short-patch-repair endonuclease